MLKSCASASNKLERPSRHAKRCVRILRRTRILPGDLVDLSTNHQPPPSNPTAPHLRPMRRRKIRQLKVETLVQLQMVPMILATVERKMTSVRESVKIATRKRLQSRTKSGRKKMPLKLRRHARNRKKPKKRRRPRRTRRKRGRSAKWQRLKRMKMKQRGRKSRTERTRRKSL